MNTTTKNAVADLNNASTRTDLLAVLTDIGARKAELIAKGADWARIEREAARAMRATR